MVVFNHTIISANFVALITIKYGYNPPFKLSPTRNCSPIVNVSGQYTKQLKKTEQTSNTLAFICPPKKNTMCTKLLAKPMKWSATKGWLHTKFETHQWTSFERNPRKFLSPARAAAAGYLFNNTRAAAYKQAKKLLSPSRTYQQKVEKMGDSLSLAAQARSPHPPYVFTFHLMKFARINNIHPDPGRPAELPRCSSRWKSGGCESTQKKRVMKMKDDGANAKSGACIYTLRGRGRTGPEWQKIEPFWGLSYHGSYLSGTYKKCILCNFAAKKGWKSHTF